MHANFVWRGRKTIEASLQRIQQRVGPSDQETLRGLVKVCPGSQRSSLYVHDVMIHWLYDFTRPGGESKAEGISRGARPPVDMVHVSLSGRRQPTVAEQLCIALWHRARIRSATNKLYLLLKKKTNKQSTPLFTYGRIGRGLPCCMHHHACTGVSVLHRSISISPSHTHTASSYHRSIEDDGGLYVVQGQ